MEKLKRSKGKFAAVLLTSCVLLSALASPVSASSTEYLWNENTREVVDPGVKVNPPIVDETAKVKDKGTKGKKDDGGIGAQWIYSQLVRYDQSSAIVDWKKKYVGVTRVDNSGNLYTGASLQFKATSSSSWEVEASGSLETEAELNLMVTKVKGTVTVGGAVRRSWTSGYEYGTESEVPPKTIGRVTAYIPGTTTKGNAVYKMTNDGTGETWYEYRARGAVVPADNAWNMVVQIPSS